MLREYLKKEGDIQLERMQQYLSLESNKVKEIFEYFVQSGWINNDNHKNTILKPIPTRT